MHVIATITSIVPNIVFFTAFKIFDAQVLWPRSRRVQGHSTSIIMVPIGSPLVVSYMTFIVSNIVSFTLLEIFFLHCSTRLCTMVHYKCIDWLIDWLIFDVRVLWPRSRTVQGYPWWKVMVRIDSPGAVSYLASIDPIVVSVTVFEIFDIKAIISIGLKPKSELNWK